MSGGSGGRSGRRSSSGGGGGGSGPASPTLKVGTRGSRLALWQADAVSAALAAAHPGLVVERVIVRTVGDRVLDAPLSQIGGKGLFTKELETALEDGAIDLAVHSLKDLPTELPGGLVIGAVLRREDPRDALVSASGRRLDELPAGARVGTSSLRRRAQLLARRPDLRIEDLRGNVPTRLEKAESGAIDAVVVARAGVIRLGMTEKITEVIAPETMLPAVGQGAIAIEQRAGDGRVGALTAALDHEPTRLATTAERALLARLEGGCQVPIGALATIEDGVMTIRAVVADLDGRLVIRAVETADVLRPGDGRTPAEHAAALGERCAERLIERGAGPILERIFALVRRGGVPAADGPEGP